MSAIAADAKQVVRAGQRGTHLTHQLLAFARREVVRPRLLDLNAVIADAEGMLRGAIGEQISLIVRPGADLPPVTCDPGQIEQLLLNLAVNARDAMPGGGQLVIDTAAHRHAEHELDLAPGDYVRLRVSDSGRGMSAEVLERAFEPFFTTKANGEGTGLGLATVYGIVTQAVGSVTIASEPGLGTTVTVLLPVGSGPSPSEPAAGDPGLDPRARRDVAGRRGRGGAARRGRADPVPGRLPGDRGGRRPAGARAGRPCTTAPSTCWSVTW